MSVENPPAFPTIGSVAFNSDWQTEHGMTLRDWFAGKALAGLMACDATNGFAWEDIARQSFRASDAMLAARTNTGADPAGTGANGKGEQS